MQHHFSAEIDPVKQRYIERNFSPPKLFRDVRDFIPNDARTATTAYGAVEEIPGSIDILIAGFVCKDLSTLNNHKKGIDGDGESHDTWLALYSYSKRYRPTVVLIENVRGQTATWKHIVSEWDASGYEAGWIILDTKDYYLPQTRMRMYMVAVDRKIFGSRATKAVADWKKLMGKLRRPCSTPFEVYLKGTASEFRKGGVGLPSTSKSETPWVQCRLKYDRIRSEERLGSKRSITRWSENGTLRPLDYGNHEWFHSRSSRELECIEIAHNQRAHADYDTRYKMEVWDVSQSMDYYSSPLGIVGCITPNGCDFVTNQQSVLTGGQMLRLQGMPNHKLMFARETQKDLQDLAGNAMSTTVIGASLISALIAGAPSFRASSHASIATSKRINNAVQNAIVKSKATKRYVLEPESTSGVFIDDLLSDAYLSSRLCSCETENVSRASVQVCHACGHTACTQHAGNPVHVYTLADLIPSSDRNQSPHDFLTKWKKHFPARLRFLAFPDYHDIFPKRMVQTNDTLVEEFVRHIRDVDIKSQCFTRGDIDRQKSHWSVSYRSPRATLKLSIRREAAVWDLYLDIPTSLPGDRVLRKILEQPVARATVHDSLLGAEWEIFLPHQSVLEIRVRASAETTPSWKNRLGLPDFKTETMPVHLAITSSAEELNGDYLHLPSCGMACDSLYKQVDSDPPLFFYLDPDLVGHPDRDGFVFSHDRSRRMHGVSRVSLACVEPSWRPWKMEAGTTQSVQATIPGTWFSAPLSLQSASVSITALVPSAPSLYALSRDCTQAVEILDIQVPEAIDGGSNSNFSWVIDRAKDLLKFSKWHAASAGNHENCACAPPLPPVLWEVGDNGTVTAHEEPKPAAIFERAQKSRHLIFVFGHSASSGSNETKIQLGLNMASLIHRAQGRLSKRTICSTAWRLCADHTNIATERHKKLALQCNATEKPFKGHLNLKYDLDSAQLKSLAWMKRQENGRRINITDVEEAIEPDLGLRAEARAQFDCTVRGGVLADRPSFGKTVTTIALIQSEFEEFPPPAILNRNQPAGGSQALLALAATLIVCPPHLAEQWQQEFLKFLGRKQYEQYNVLLVEDFTQLKTLTIKDLEKSRVVVLSWGVLSDPAYIAQLARFAAMPEPATTTGSGYDAWLAKINDILPGRLDALITAKNFDMFKAASKDLLQERLSHQEFQTIAPVKLGHGSAYVSFKSMQAAAKKAKATKTKAGTKAKATAPLNDPKHPIPFLQLFHFNRVVIDEYHYLFEGKGENHPAYAALKAMSASKRWILSGTPALTNFSDVNEIASLLGVKLGRSVCGDGFTTTLFEKRLLDGQTDVQKFLSRTETMSPQWHRARHERAQEFLDMFVRKNKPSLDYIVCKEILRPITLDLAHHAVYLELSHHLIAQKMKLKKAKGETNADRINRLNSILDESATAEDALLKRALLFETAPGESGIDFLIQKRKAEQKEIEAEIVRLLVGFHSQNSRDAEIKRHYQSFKSYVETPHELGDKDASNRMRRLLLKAVAQARASPKGLPEVERLKGDKFIKALKMVISQIRGRARELVLCIRSVPVSRDAR